MKYITLLALCHCTSSLLHAQQFTVEQFTMCQFRSKWGMSAGISNGIAVSVREYTQSLTRKVLQIKIFRIK